MKYSASICDITVPEALFLSLEARTAEQKFCELECLTGITIQSNTSLKPALGVDTHNALALLHVLFRMITSSLAKHELLRGTSDMQKDLSSYIDLHITANDSLTEHRLQFQENEWRQSPQAEGSQRSPSFSPEIYI